jgi:hypothetical protein
MPESPLSSPRRSLMVALVLIPLAATAGLLAHKADLSSQWGLVPMPPAPVAAPAAPAGAPPDATTPPAPQAAAPPAAPDAPGIVTAFSTFTKDSAFAINVSNDAQFVHVTLRVSDPEAIRQALRRGLIVWFNPKGNKDKDFGIEYPVPGFNGSGQRGSRGRFGGGGQGEEGESGSSAQAGPPPSGSYGQPEDAATMLDAMRRNGRLDTFAVLGPKKDDRQTLEVDKSAGILVQVHTAEGTLVYDLQVPLAPGPAGTYAINSAAGREIGVGLATPEFERPNAGGRQGMGGGGFGGGGRGGFGGGGGGFGGGFGGRGGMGGGRGGMGGGRGGMAGNQGDQPKPLKEWTSVQLAAGPSTH